MFKSILGKLAPGSQASAAEGQTYAIGDVHGCAHELEILLKKLSIDKETTVVFLGDYVDRGPDSRRVIDLVLELASRCKVIPLMGNHEAMFLDFLERPESMGSGLFILNGGGSTLANYATTDGAFDVPHEHIEFLKGLKVFHQTETHFFVHAGVPLRKKLEELNPIADREVFLWTRGPFLSTDESWGKIIVHGHTPNEQPERRHNRVNCDTGCVFGGSLTAYDVTGDKFISVDRVPLSDQPPILHKQYDGKRIAVRFNGRMVVNAGRPGEARQPFETLNYNQFGLLLRETQMSANPFFELNDFIEGVIGNDYRTAVEFEGQVVRVEARQGLVVFGVKLDKISTRNDSGHHGNWLKRPAS